MQISLMKLKKNRSSDYGYTSLLIKVPTKNKLRKYASEDISYDKVLWKLMQVVDNHPEIVKEIEN